MIKGEPRVSGGCALCVGRGETVVWQATDWRVIRAEEPGYPLIYRVVPTRHVAEFTDLSRAERIRCLDLVAAVESAIRQNIPVHKINLCSLGNLVPHLHWHVIPRMAWDAQFPGAIWAPARRPIMDGLWSEAIGDLRNLDTAVITNLETVEVG